MFGARKDEGWRLCHRSGKTIVFINEKLFPDIIVEFPTQRQAKACADDMNELWDDYWKPERKGDAPTVPVFWGYLDLLAKHNGISPDDLKEINDYETQRFR